MTEKLSVFATQTFSFKEEFLNIMNGKEYNKLSELKQKMVKENKNYCLT